MAAVSKPFKNPEYEGPKKFKNLKQILAAEKLLDVPVDAATYSNIQSAPTLLPVRKYCDITGLEAKLSDYEECAGVCFGTREKHLVTISTHPSWEASVSSAMIRPNLLDKMLRVSRINHVSTRVSFFMRPVTASAVSTAKVPFESIKQEMDRLTLEQDVVEMSDGSKQWYKDSHGITVEEALRAAGGIKEAEWLERARRTSSKPMELPVELENAAMAQAKYDHRKSSPMEPASLSDHDVIDEVVEYDNIEGAIKRKVQREMRGMDAASLSDHDTIDDLVEYENIRSADEKISARKRSACKSAFVEHS
ncbi:INO80 complex subunit C [Gonapodya sp. JEL0774]|nr:INO80 complex subunit C [Gonapodya sp. JEL0774]